MKDKMQKTAAAIEKIQGPLKAYKNLQFLTSPEARMIRILSEFLEPASRFRKHKIHDTIVFFGSARIQEPLVAKRILQDAKANHKRNHDSKHNLAILKAAQMALKMSKYYEAARQLAKVLTEWSNSLGKGERRFIICSGGGPGIMEAANRGATEAPNGYTIGLNISLPYEQFPNPYITPNLEFEFHYFFVRKYWFMYLAKALVVFPGGFGTLDELFEVLTLSQTHKVKKKMPVVIFGKEYWKKLINFEALLEYGTISQEDIEMIRFCDDVEEAFIYLKDQLTALYLK